MSDRRSHKKTVAGERLHFMAAKRRTFCRAGRCYAQAWDVLLYGAWYEAIEGRGDTRAEALAELWARVAQSKHYADRYANNAGPTAGADGL